VANLNLVAVRPAVPNFVPRRFCVAPVRGADTGFCQGGGSSWCRRGWDASCAHLCNGELDVGNDFGECGIGGDQVFNGGVLLNGCICQIVEGRCHLLCLFEFGSLICNKRCLAGNHAIDIAHLGKGGSPVGLPVGLIVVKDWAMFPLAPGQLHVVARQGMLGTCGDHGFVEDGDSGIGSKDLTLLLLCCVDSKGEAGVNAGMEVGHVVIQIRLADLGVSVEDVHD
jgi:hypothetical protein